ncbi:MULTISPECIES: molybdopterin-dependent oxidoreductase [unclassified Adlercreutzia]|uniref:molybdopterin-containing oxidoreductase family protein n=1 Tax=unclassified Adlercreutzia TaxID=2636013 RepID=UPI0013EA98F1|nr:MULTISPECIES: molybdopterin-dependent oxidoreductase [unclassified Adlercreutzia]
MTESMSRRTFVKGAGATAALAATGAVAAPVGSLMTERAHAAEAAPDVRTAPSLCNGCSSKCGLTATTVGGKLWTVEGLKGHPYSKGTVCGRAHGLAQMAYSDERVTQPLRRKDDGTFEPISWDDAFAEIGERVQSIIAKNGPESVALIHDPRPSGKYYGPRFMNALGSANVYTHGAACNSSKESGIVHTTGASNFSVDFANAKMVVFIGRSYGDAIRPSSVKSLADAADAAKRIVVVDPRLSNSGVFATDWVPIKPGTDLALLMGIAHVLIAEDLYDRTFVEEHTVGFEEFAQNIASCTPKWAEGVCEVPADTITELARALAKAAPAAAIEPSWRAAFGCSYANSFDTARGVTAVNALLGSWGQKGGALITSSPKPGSLDAQKFPSVPKPAKKRVGDAAFPLVPSGMGSNLAALQAALDGDMKAFFFYNSNAAQGYAQPKVWREGLDKAELVVTIDVQMSETAVLSDYVLPECTYLERMELPDFIGGKKHYVGMRTPALERVHPETRSCDEIFTGLARACGVGEYFDFTLEELASAQLESVGVTLEEVCEKGVVELADPHFTYGVPKFKTPSGKFEFKSDKAAEAGRSAVIGFAPRLVEAKEGELYLIGGKQGIHSHTMTMNIPALNAVSRDYDLERLWMAASDAAARGIADGDLVEVASSEHAGKVRVHVTQRVKPGVLFLPTHYGITSPYQTHARGLGINHMDFVPFRMEPGVGSAMSQEVAVTVKKVEA